MKIPRDIDGIELVKALKVLGYAVTRQNGSHIRLTTHLGGEHHEVIPNHSPVRIGTLKSILRNVAMHHKMRVDELVSLLDL